MTAKQDIQQEPRKLDIALLEKEYFHLQETVESFDAKSLTIKAWSITLVGAIAGSGTFFNQHELLLFGSGASLMFWLIDAAWKTFQNAYYGRIREIEAFMRGECTSIANFQMSRSWSASYGADRSGRFAKVMFWPHVLLPHGAMFMALLIAFLFLGPAGQHVTP